jgi:pyruvate dehydrogenase E1 component alpha subunit
MGHYVGDPMTYRRKEEVEGWKQNRDALDGFESRTVEAGIISADELRSIDGEVAEEVEAAVVEAERAPFPEPEDLLVDVYVGD